MVKNYLKTALRNLFRNRTYAAINIAGLSLGLACAMLIILYLKDELSYDRFHANGAQIYRIYAQASGPDGEIRRMGITGAVQGPRFTEKIPEIKAFVRVQGGYADVKSGVSIQPQPLLVVDSNFFSIFSFPLLQGNARTVLLQPNAVVLSEDAARKYFGSTDITGRVLQMRRNNKFDAYTVTGVAKRCPQNSSLQFDVLLPQQVDASVEKDKSSWTSFFLNTYVLLDAHASLAAVESKMTRVFVDDAPELVKQMEAQSHAKFNGSYKLQPFTEIHLNNDMDRVDIAGASNKMYSYILSGIAFFILMIACINFVNLTLARSMKRAKEIGIRKVTGGSRRQLVVQFLGESLILCLLAFALALVMVQVLLPVFNRFADKALALSYLLDLKLMAGFLALFLATGLLAGFYPALVLSAYTPVQTLYNRINLSGKNYLQKCLVVFQFTLATFLIGMTGVLYFQFNFLVNTNLGYDDANLVLVNKQNLTRAELAMFSEELFKNSSIAGLAAKDAGYSFNAGKVNGDKEMGFANTTVDENYLPMLKIPILQGRNFSKSLLSDPTAAVLVNETFVKQAGWKNPVGQSFSFGDEAPYRVIGVVKDYHFQALNQAIVPQVLSMRPQNDLGTAYIKIKPGSNSVGLAHIEKTFKALFPLAPFAYVFKDQENLKQYEAEARWKQVLIFGSVLTVFISCIGLLGLSVLATEKRRKEIGIRKILGASVKGVVSILSTTFLKPVFIALIIASPLAWLTASKWLQQYPYRITLNGWLFAAAALLVVIIAWLTVSFQAVRAAMANPVKALRTE